MKMKKNKLSNFLQAGILLFVTSILLWNCEQENSDTVINTQSSISIEQIQKQFYSAYNESAFSKKLPTPNWNENRIFYDDEGNQYLEIPFQTINQQDIEKGTSVSFDKLIAISINNKIELKIVHFFGINIINNPVDFKNISHTELYNFTGFVTLYDLNKNVLDIKQYNKGEDTLKKISIGSKSKDENSVLARVDESTWEYTETICTRGCWYWEYSNGSRETISCSPWECTTTTYSGSGGNGSGNSGNNTSYNTNENTECAEGYTYDEEGKCRLDEQIVNNLTGNEKCVYEKLKELDLFKSTIKKFGNGSNYNLILNSWTNGACNSGIDDGCTDASDLINGNITIYIQNPGRGTLDTAALILHEGIHAEIYKYVDEHNSGIDPNNRANLLSYYFQYKAQNDNTLATSTAQHQHMADKYVKPIAQALRQLDNNQYSLNDYMGLAWDGLRRYGWDGYYDEGNWITLDRNDYIGNINKVLDNTDFNKNCN